MGGVMSVQTLWLAAYEPHRLQPIGDPGNEDKCFLISANRGFSRDHMPLFSTVILRRHHPHPTLPHRGGGLFFAARIGSPEQIEMAVTRHYTREGAARGW